MPLPIRLPRALYFALVVGCSLVLPAENSSAAVDVSGLENLRPARPVIPARTFHLADFGGVADGRTLNTAVFTRAIAAVAAAGGGHLVVAPGIYISGPFVLCSNLDLHLEAGAVIRAPATFAELGLPDPASIATQLEASAVVTPEPLITGRHLHDVSLTGTGTIDGNGAHWWAWSERASRASPGRLIFGRPHLIEISGCARLLVADLTLMNSSRFHLVPRDITDLTIERVKVRAPFNAPNTDAIDPGPGRNFWIHDCDIDTGDDDIVIKSGGTNILIENNTIHHGHGISIGSGTTVGIHNMLVRHCTFDGADDGIRIKSMKGAGGVVENVRYTDIRMKNVGYAILLTMNYVDDNRPNFVGDPKLIPDFHDILIDHVTVENAKNGGKIAGLPGHAISRITLRDVALTAGTDLVATDAADVVYENVRRTIVPTR